MLLVARGGWWGLLLMGWAEVGVAGAEGVVGSDEAGVVGWG